MNNRETLESLSKEELIRLLELNAKNWLALEGVWFQAVERGFGMDAAMRCDEEAWRRYTVIEARRIKEFLALPERPGLDGLARALRLRAYASLNDFTIERTPDALVFRNTACRVQTARGRNGMPFHPCKPVGLVEYAGFARTIDDRIACRCLSCYPDIADASAACAWKFILAENPDAESEPVRPAR